MRSFPRTTATISKSITFALGALLVASPVKAQDKMQDPVFSSQVFEFNIGIAAPLNTLQNTLTHPNDGGATILTTDSLNFGTGGYANISYSRPWGDASRFYIELSGTNVTGSETTIIEGSQSFPGSYDDGYQLPDGWTYQNEVETDLTFLKAGREWALINGWRTSVGLQAGQVSQNLETQSFDLAMVSSRRISATASNKMLGAYGGISNYHALNDTTALRTSANIGLMANSYDYSYLTINSLGDTDQSIDVSGDSTAYSANVSIALEHQVIPNGYVTFEIGMDGLFGVVNGADTFLDPAGTATTAHIDRDDIVSSYISVGYAFLF
jgi:hypothetical protein